MISEDFDLLKITETRAFIHSLRKVKKMKNVFYVRQKYIRHGYRAHRQLNAC